MGAEQTLLGRDSGQLAEMLVQIIRSFRSGYALLSKEERKFVHSIDALNRPTQIEAIWFRPPDVQYLLVTHFSDLRDLEISIDGPFPSYDAMDQLQQIVEKPKWNRQTKTKIETRWSLVSPKNFREIVEDVCVELIRDLGRQPFLRPVKQPTIAGKSLLTPTASLWYVAGHLAGASPEAIAGEIIDGAKTQAQLVRKTGEPSSPLQTAPRIPAHGGFIFPPVWIGKAPKPTFVQRLSRAPLFPSKAYEGTYKNRMFIADQDGFLAIAESDKLKATVLLNEIMAVRLMDGKPTYALREQEVTETRIDPQEKRITSKGVTSLSPRASMMDEWLRESWHVPQRLEVISVEALEGWLRKTEKVTQSDTLSETLRFLLEAHSHFHYSDYLESFVLSWLIVERDVFARWHRYLEGRSIEATRMGKLENPHVWTAELVIEELSLAGSISMDDYQKLMSMKTVRNGLIHKQRRVSKEQANELLELALVIVRKEVAGFEKLLPGSKNSRRSRS